MKQSQQAFTLIEVLTVLGIIIILSALTVPGLKSIYQRAEEHTICAELIRLLENAENEAGTLHKTVTVCKSGDQRTCSGEWSAGQIVFVDALEDGIVHDTAQIIAVHKMQIKHGKLLARFYPRYREFIQFRPLVYGNNDNGTLWYCRHDAVAPVFAIKISKTGSVHALYPDQKGEIRDGKDKLISCL